MIAIGLGEYAITSDINETLITHALGSCVALLIHCPITHCTAMAHIVLPVHLVGMTIDQKKDAYFASDIVPKIMEMFLKNPRCQLEKLQVDIIGGATIKQGQDVFNIGPKNVNLTKRLLNQYPIQYRATEVLGNYSRTVKINAGTGDVYIKRQLLKL